MRIPTEFVAIDKFSSVVAKMTGNADKFGKTTQSAVDRLNTKLTGVRNNLAMGGAAIIAPLGIAVNSAIAFEDKMADVAKTTGLSTTESDAYGKAILDMSKKTRTSISALQDIGIVAGTIGVAKDELVAFTKAGNEFSIALGSDFSGGTEEAVTQVAKLKNLFKETRDIKIADAMTKAGSAINEVSNVAGSASNINQFALSIGTMNDAIKPTISQTIALGGFLEDAGINAEKGAGGFKNLISVAGENLPNFAKQMKLSVSGAKDLFNTNPLKFAQDFSKSFKGMKGTDVISTLHKLKVGSLEVQQVVGALGAEIKDPLKTLESIEKLSFNSFGEAASVGLEAGKKNETLAGKLAMAKNNMEALSITIGTTLAPMLEKVIPKITSLVEKFSAFIEENPNLIPNLAIIGGLMWGLSLAVGGVQAAMTIGSFIMAGYTTIIAAYEDIALTAALTGSSFAAVIWATVWPILAVIVAIAAIIAIFYYWDDIVAWFSEQWTAFTTFLSEFDFVGMFMSIGQSIIDFMLFPLKTVLGLVASLPGSIGEAAQTGLDKLNEMSNLGVSVKGEVPKLESPDQMNAKMMQENRLSGGFNLNVRDKGNNIESINPFGMQGIPVNVTSTQGQR